MATISPGKTWLPLNVTIDANDRGDSTSSEGEILSAVSALSIR